MKNSRESEEIVEESKEIKEEIKETEGEEQGKRKQGKGDIFREVCSWVAVIGFAIVAAYLINSYIIVNANIPTGSMENTIAAKSKIIGFRFSYWFSEPERGDIVIFKAPDDPEVNYVKRVIGLPGEKVRIDAANIYITPADGGEEFQLEEDYLKEEWVIMNDNLTYEVPENSYLMLGDNRNSSRDSRYWKNQYVKKSAILGKAIFCYYPKLYMLH